jgi:uracil-DNA glycosylase
MPVKGSKQGLTPLQHFVERWKHGCGSDLCRAARKVVLGKGSVPCDVLFVGEAPGESENVIGQPFVGPAGRLLDHIVNEAIAPHRIMRYSVAFCNLVCCIPRDEDGGKLRQPDDDDIRACSERLKHFVRVCDPRLIVCVGAVARDWLDEKRRDHVELHRTSQSLGGSQSSRFIPRVDIVHPASVLRANIAQQGLMVQRAVVTIASAVEKYVDGKA